MTKKKTAAIVLAAGLGTRMKSTLPKVMHPLAGRPMISMVMETLSALAPERVVVVTGKDMEQVAEAVNPNPTVIQEPRLGTAHAVMAARPELDGFDGDVLVLYGDSPLISSETLRRMLAAKRGAPHPAVVVLGFRPADPGAYGRLMVDDTGYLESIVEAADATPGQAAVGLCNSGVMVIDGTRLFDLVAAVGNDNAKGEYYLTDIVALARSQGLTCAVVEGGEEELVGVDSRSGLAWAEAVVQRRLRAAAMDGGATLTDPGTVHFCFDTRLGRDVTVGPHVVFGPGVTIGDGVEILSFSHIEGAKVAAGVRIGPFARLRPGADIAENAHIGNFVEIKNATVEAGAKANHLAYIGDARIGAGANIGAGTITCNYDGFLKHHTDIGAGAFIGSNTALVAPVKIGDGAVIGAGSTIIRDVPADALTVERSKQATVEGWAKSYREKKAAEKAAKVKGKAKGKG